MTVHGVFDSNINVLENSGMPRKTYEFLSTEAYPLQRNKHGFAFQMSIVSTRINMRFGEPVWRAEESERLTHTGNECTAG